jgi:hypothetical protein
LWWLLEFKNSLDPGTLYGIPKMNYNNILAKKETLINHFYNPIQKTAQFFYPSLEKNEEFKDKKIIATLRATSRRNSLFFTYCLTINPAHCSISKLHFFQRPSFFLHRL